MISRSSPLLNAVGETKITTQFRMNREPASMAGTLSSKTLQAVSWSFIESVSIQGVQFGVGIVLARLLLPEEFGLVGMLTIFITLAQAFLSSGFGVALIQKQDATTMDTCSVFYFNIVLGAAMTGLLWVAAPWIAAFYDRPILIPLTRALSLTMFIGSFGLIQIVLLTKQINFKTQTHVSLIASLLSGALGIGMAVKGFGVWSLAVQQISATFFRTVLLWFLNPWRPALLFSFHSLRKMFSFGSRVLASALLNEVFNNIYFLVIGKLFSATDLGFYTRAKSLEELPSRTMSNVVARVTFPVFSAIQGDRVRLKRGLKKALTTLVLVNFPMTIGFAVIARPLVLFLFTEKWAVSIPYLQLLCVAGLSYPLHLINLNVLQAIGRSDLYLRLEIIKRVLTVITIAITWQWGISGLIYGIIGLSLFSYYLNSYYTGSLVDYPILEQLRDLSPYLLASLLMGLGVYAAGRVPFPNPGSMLLVQVPLGIVIYVCLCRMFRLQAFTELWQSGRGKIAVLRTQRLLREKI